MRKAWQVILAIDWGSKYIGLAYMEASSEVVFPVWYMLNDSMLYFSLADVIHRYKVTDIVIGIPKNQKDIRWKIIEFVDKLSLIIDVERVSLHYIDEDYTTVQAGEIISEFKKNVASDTVSAMIILERWKTMRGQ
jgi:RNase H-fold protein (predicted Holliday junction resolvase)